MKMNDLADAVKTNPIYAIGIKPNFKGKKILLRLTINGRRESFGYYAESFSITFLPELF